jgi:hypothetical protein
MVTLYQLLHCRNALAKNLCNDNFFGQLVVIDVNPWRVILEIDVNPWRSLEAPNMWTILLESWFGKMVVIDVNPWRVMLDINFNPYRFISTLRD